MDRQLAERMVGAACLLAVLVLVVPAILDGNPDSGATITHPAAGGEDSLDLRTHTIRLDAAEREPPVPSARNDGPPVSLPAPKAPVQPSARASGNDSPSGIGDSESPVVTAARPTEAKPAPEAAPTAALQTAKPAAATVPDSTEASRPSSGDWVVQLGSFSQRDNADRLAADLKRKGFAASVQGGGGSSGKLFRVRAGPEPDKGAAEDLARRLAAAGFAGGRVGRR